MVCKAFYRIELENKKKTKKKFIDFDNLHDYSYYPCSALHISFEPTFMLKSSTITRSDRTV